MYTKYPSSKRLKRNTSHIFTHTSSSDVYSNLDFLTGAINANDPLLLILLSGRITNSSFSDLYKRSKQIGWEQLFIDERSKLKLDEKSKIKRIMLNRLIHACSKISGNFDQQIQLLIEEMKNQMSDPISPERDHYIRLRLYEEIKAWVRTQCERRLFYKEQEQLCNLLTLQRLMTDQLIELITSFNQNPHVSQLEYQTALMELFKLSLIIVVQPSGTDCIAATKYEKVGNNFLAKLKTRIISLLDPTRVDKYLKISDIDVILQPDDSIIDPDGDRQSPLSWTIRKIMTTENTERTFLYAELKENDFIKLTKLNGSRRPLYNRELCKLQFETKFELINNIIPIEVSVRFTSQLFGLCSHSKYYPKYLAKVFIAEVDEIQKNIDLNTHINVLKGYIFEFHKRCTSVEVKLHTQQFIVQSLQEFYEVFKQSASSPTAPVMFFSWNIYEDVLIKLFNQIKFLATRPYLAMMYHDNLFRGISSDTIDEKISQNISNRSSILLRFQIFHEQDPAKPPNIIVVKYNNVLTRTSITHDYFINDMCKCCQKTAENDVNSLEIFNDDKTLPFYMFHSYYDNGLTRDNLIQVDDNTMFHVNSIQNNQYQSTEEENLIHKFHLSAQFTGNKDLTNKAISFLREQFIYWCRSQNITGTLCQSSMEQETDLSDTNERHLFDEILSHIELDEFFSGK
ncbi:unnamed protein product [Adineta steineri]|uniref:Uncharacterized protein n=1 Tax=Adineta steineri TaxID=433720 RepID=A0A818IWP3_9BILA|nr:unnamed protein product [Adineta steineri]CAF1030113.1 unnamed protein product [Adineta steineri]CAF3530907.1 unnamed protein product [Adineta steineri]CAF3556860.1 unnamed protein product [Adineta steineri]